MTDCFKNWATSVMKNKHLFQNRTSFSVFVNIKIPEIFKNFRCFKQLSLEICDHFSGYLFDRIQSNVRPDPGPDTLLQSDRTGLDVRYTPRKVILNQTVMANFESQFGEILKNDAKI